MQLRIPFVTLLKIALFLLLVFLVIKLWPVIVMVFVAVLIAVMLAPLAAWLERKGMKHGVAVGMVALVLLLVIAAFVLFAIPSIVSQVRELAKNAPAIRQRMLQDFPILQRVPNPPPIQTFLRHGLTASLTVVEGVTVFFLVLVLAVYFVLDGRPTFEWLISFAPAAQRGRWRKTAEELNDIVLAYMRGQLITCVLCSAWVLLVVSLLRIPAPVPIALLAFIADLVPVIGTIVMLVPAVALALTVSPMRAVLVVAAYAFYHVVESYFIVPRVYGRQMRLSTLTVLISITAGGTLMGPLGAVLILPVVASYPIIERIWLRDELPADTVARHEAIEAGD